jgi:hypothetical protein
MSLVVFELIQSNNQLKNESRININSSFLSFLFHHVCKQRIIDDNQDSTNDMTELLRAQADDTLIDGHEVFK